MIYFYNTCIVFAVIVSVLLIGIVLIQKSKGGGLSSQFGNASATMGVRQTNSFLEKGTWWLIGILVVLSILSAYASPDRKALAARTSTDTEATQPASDFPIPDPNAPVIPGE